MELKYKVSTDSEKTIKLNSTLIAAEWQSGVAYAGQAAAFSVRTSLVGEGAPIKVQGNSAKGKKLGKVEGVVRGNSFVGQFDIPEDIELGDEIFFEAKLSKNSIDGKSGHIPVRPLVVVSKLEWSAADARRGDIVTLSAEVKGVAPDTEAIITIYEFDKDGVHDRIVELPVKVVGKKLELDWAYEYYEDTDEIPTDGDLEQHDRKYSHPEYFFTVKFDRTEFGLDQESGLLKFKDYVEITATDIFGKPLADRKYKLVYADGEEVEGNLDKEGYAKVLDVPPGRYDIIFPKEG